MISLIEIGFPRLVDRTVFKASRHLYLHLHFLSSCFFPVYDYYYPMNLSCRHDHDH